MAVFVANESYAEGSSFGAASEAALPCTYLPLINLAGADGEFPTTRAVTVLVHDLRF